MSTENLSTERVSVEARSQHGKWVPGIVPEMVPEILPDRRSQTCVGSERERRRTRHQTRRTRCDCCVCGVYARMRCMTSTAVEATAADDSNEVLTTGEVARLLNCSRQHVVNLCDEGLLPFQLVGTHRRVRRDAVEAMRAGPGLSREERRSLWLAHAVAGKIVDNPDTVIRRAHDQLELMRPMVRGRARAWIAEWGQLLDGPVDVLIGALTDRSSHGCELRQNSPFAGALTADERDRVLAAWRQHDRRSDG